MPTPPLEVRRLDLDTDHDLLEQWSRVRAEAESDDMGEFASPYTLEEYRAAAASQTSSRTPFIALLDGDPVGGGNVTLPLRDNTSIAWLTGIVAPHQRRHGAGAALMEAMERYAIDNGRTSLLTQTNWLPEGAEPTNFLTGRGYERVQVAIQQELDPADLVMAPPPASDDPYAAHVWTGMPPDRWVDDLAVLHRRMSTDAPMGEMDVEEEVWDAARVRASAQRAVDGGRERVEAVIEDTSTGGLVAFTYLEKPRTPEHLAFQEDTLVLREHRGHGLGWRVKAAAYAALRAQLPHVTTVRTWNAQENEHMRNVNVSMGFREVALEGIWQRRRD